MNDISRIYDAMSDEAKERYRAPDGENIPALPKLRPVAWRVKDHADGWILYSDERAAYMEAERTGAEMQGLYIRDGR